MKIPTTLALLATLTVPLPAAVIVAGDVFTPGAPCTFEITTDIHFSIIADAVDKYVTMAFDNWVTTDGSRNDLPMSPAFAYQLNGVDSALPVTFSDNFNDNFGVITPDDGFIYFELPTPLLAGDVFTIKAGVYNFSGDAAFNPQTVGTFTGSLLLVDNSGSNIAVPTAVPEPSAALLGLAGAALFLRRRR